MGAAKGDCTEILKRDVELFGLLFDKGACSGGTGLIHLKIDHNAVFQADVF